MNEWRDVRRILAVRMDNLGDVVMLGPALRAVKEALPRVSITLLASSGGAGAAQLLPWVDDVIPWRALWQEVGHAEFQPAHERELIELLARRGFDAALIFTSFSQTPHVPGYVCHLAGIPLRAGESKEFGGNTLTTELKGAPDELHQAERNLRLVEHLGFAVRDRDLSVYVPDAARRRAESLLVDVGIDPVSGFVLLHPGASADARRYPPERFAEAARLLMREGWQVLVTGLEREAEITEQVISQAPEARRLVGRTSLTEYAALVESARLVVCNNTLPMHLADAVRTPTVVMFSGTEREEQWQPRATAAKLLRAPTPCSPCYLFECPIGKPCLDIPPEIVASAALELLAADNRMAVRYRSVSQSRTV